ncbi:MAG: response regulator [Lachnospiraceae bacterium]|nr:response regulator [Lachnospiraceae bacterium]
MNTKKAERIIVIAYSAYTLAMSVAATVLQWPAWITPTIIGIMLISWMAYIKEWKDYRTRAFLFSGSTLITFSLYAFMSDSFPSIMITFTTVVILLGLLGVPRLVYLEFGFCLIIFLYHLLIKKTIPLDTGMDKYRLFVQMASVFVAEIGAHYLVKRNGEMNREMQEVIEELKVAERSKTDFMANISHEIRTPVNTVCGMSEMILREDIPEDVRENTFNIQTAGRNLLSLISDVLDYSELEYGKMELVEEPYNLTSTINDVINMAIAQKGSKNLELIVDCDAKIPYTLLGDEQKIRRVILSFVNNAIKFTEAGCITLVFSARQEEYGINLSVKVKDTGIGIEPENLEKLFSSFNQVDTKRNRQEGGIGIGLAISKRIISKMGGFISVRSTFGKGSEFQFVIPQKVVDERPMVAVRNAESINIIAYINTEKYEFAEIRDDYMNNIRHMVESLEVRYHQCRNLGEFKRRMEKEIYTHAFITTSEYMEDKQYFDELSDQMVIILLQNRENSIKAGGNIKSLYKPFYVLSIASVLNGEYSMQRLDGSHYQDKKFIAPEANILVVDDNLMNLKVVEGLLRPYKIKVFVATSGKECLEKLDSSRYDIIFMDHMMPEMDGVETAHKIRAKAGAYFQNVPIVALTANAIGGAREMFLEEGFQEYVAKPIEMSHLERVLRKYIPENKIIRMDDATEPLEPVTETIENEGESRIDRRRGIQYCGGNEDDYKEILQVYLTSGLQKIREIREKYKAEDWKNYTILVHALKSTSIGIGATALGEMAKELEMAGKEGNISFIQARHREVMHEYEEVLLEIGGETIRDKFEKGPVDINAEESEEQVVLEEITEDRFAFHLKELTELLNTFEKGGVDAKIQELSKYSFKGKNLKDLLKPISEQVSRFDFLSAAEDVAKLLEEGGNADA